MLPVPSTLSPSKAEAFTRCPLSFRLSAIERLPESTTPAAARGSLVHLVLQRLFWAYPRGARTLDVAVSLVPWAFATQMAHPEAAGLVVDDEEVAGMQDAAVALLHRYFAMEDPNQVEAIGTELYLRAEVDGVVLSGIIDRLDLTSDGELVVTDYKTGPAPGVGFERRRFKALHHYSLLCEEVLGRRPARVQLLYLASGETLVAESHDQSSRFVRLRARALWDAVEHACATGDFPPNPGYACDWCGYHAYCPAQGGDLSLIPVREDRPGADAPDPAAPTDA